MPKHEPSLENSKAAKNNAAAGPVLTAQTLTSWTRKIAQRRSETPSTGHLLCALYQHDSSVRELLFSHGVTETKLLEATRATRENDSILEVTLEHAAQLTQLPMGCVWGTDVLLAIMRNPRTAGSVALLTLGVSSRGLSSDKVVEESMAAPVVARRDSRPPVVAGPTSSTRTAATPKKSASQDAQPKQTRSLSERATSSVLARVASDIRVRLSSEPTHGRAREIELALDAMGRMRGSGAMLLGESGVGKSTTLLEVARALAACEPESNLLDVSMPALLSQTGVRGALAERFSSLQKELLTAGATVLFFDDLHHALLGEAGEELVTRFTELLDTPGVRCVTTGSTLAFHKLAEKHPAFARRFAKIVLAEPDREGALDMVRAASRAYAAHHNLSIPETTLSAAVDWSMRFLPERHLPEKALSLLDIAASRAKRRNLVELSPEALAEVVASETHVPVERLMMRDQEHLLALESTLQQRVLGQEDALRTIAESVRRGAAGFRGKRPLATFLFLGPTGVGKTETARALAEHVFGENNFVRFDMSEFAEAHTVARLFGAPPGYIGHERGGELTDAVRARPYQLVLFDEMEKAHPSVLLSLLALLDEGRVTDSKGRLVDFRNTIVVMTSNLGVAGEKAPRVGFGGEVDVVDVKQQTLAACRRALPPELWNRIDEPLFFAPLSRASVCAVAAQMVSQVAKSMMREHAVTLNVGEGVYDKLLDLGGFDAALGARPMRRVVSRAIEAPLANQILRGEIVRGATVSVRVVSGSIVVTSLSTA